MFRIHLSLLVRKEVISPSREAYLLCLLLYSLKIASKQKTSGRLFVNPDTPFMPSQARSKGAHPCRSLKTRKMSLRIRFYKDSAIGRNIKANLDALPLLPSVSHSSR